MQRQRDLAATEGNVMTVRLAALALAVMLPLVTACGRAPDLVGIENPEVPVASVAGITRHRIFITSTREASEVAGTFFSGERAPALGLASVEVTVPPTHVLGELERARRLPPDPRTEFTVIEPVVFRNDAAFVGEMNRVLAALPRDERRILLFVHGYNTTTSDAILRLGQFVEDTGFEGVPVLFTWASAASVPRYVYDLNSALVARVQIKHMARLMNQTNAEGIDIFAHSMGTFLTMEGLVDFQLAGTLDSGGKIDSVILASPDIDIDLFRTQINILPPAFRGRIHLLISKDDAALRVSRGIAGGVPRVGAADAMELEDLGVTVIDLSEVDDSSAGSHSKFAGSPEVVQLIGRGLNTVDRFDEGSPGLQQLLANAQIQVVGN
jgi:esterase/lipase superfamily enzyme